MQIQIAIDGEEFGTVELTKEINRGPKQFGRPTSGRTSSKDHDEAVVALQSLSEQALSWIDKNIR